MRRNSAVHEQCHKHKDRERERKPKSICFPNIFFPHPVIPHSMGQPWCCYLRHTWINMQLLTDVNSIHELTHKATSALLSRYANGNSSNVRLVITRISKHRIKYSL